MAENQNNCNYLPLNGKLSVPKVIGSGEELTKEQLEAKLFGGTTLVDLPDQNDLVPLMESDESGNKSIPRAIPVDNFAQVVAEKIEIPDPGVVVEKEEVDFGALDAVSVISESDFFLVGPTAATQEESSSTNRKINAPDLAAGLQRFMDIPDLSENIDDAKKATSLTNETVIPVKKQGSSVEKATLNDLTGFLKAAPVCKRFLNHYNVPHLPVLTEASTTMTRLDYSEDMKGKFPHVLIICGIKFKAQNGLTYYDVVTSDIIPLYSVQTFYHTKASVDFGYFDLYFNIHGSYLEYRINSMEVDESKNDFQGIYVQEVWGINFGNRDTSSGGGSGEGSSLHLGDLTPITNFAKEDMFLVEDTLGDQYSITGEALANRLKSFMNLDMSHGTVAFFSVNNLNDLHASEPYPISKNALIGAKPSIGEDLSYPCIFEVAEEDGDILKLHYGMFKIKEETETEYKIKVSNYSDILLYEDVSRGSMLLTILDTLPKKDEEKNFTDYAFTGRWPEVDHTTRQGFIIVNWKLYMVEYSVVFVGGMNIQIKFVKDPVLVSGGFPDIYTTEDIQDAESITMEDKMLLGTADGNKKIDQNTLIEFLKGQDLIDLDGKGRPLLPGYGIVTKSFTKSSNGTWSSVVICNISDFGFTSINDVAFISGNHYSDIFSGEFQLMKNGDIRIYNNSNGVSFSNETFDISIIYKQKVPYEPGLKSITKEFTVSGDNLYGTICNISDFGIDDISNIVDMFVYCKNDNYNTNYLLHSNGNIIWIYYPKAINFSNYTFSVTLLVKDYSSIGPAIVTDGIRMITKEFKLNTSGRGLTVATFSELGISETDYIGVLANLKNSPISIIGYVENGNIKIIPTFDTQSLASGLEGVISLFVKVPVVEQKLKPFTKDVTLTINGDTGVSTGIVLNGSDDVGGYTVNNFHSIDICLIVSDPLNTPAWISSYAVDPDSGILYIAAYSNDFDGTGTFRITIE